MVGYLRIFLAALSKVFRKASLSLMKEQFSLVCVQYLLVFRLLSGYTGERLIPGLRRKDWILRALWLAVTSLWPHKVGSRVEIYSARFFFKQKTAYEIMPSLVGSEMCIRDSLHKA